MIDSQMDDMIKEKLVLKEQVDLHWQNLYKQIKEKESLLHTFTIFKNESKEKENKYMENEIDLEKKIKELGNIIFKVGQSAQTVHMLTKPQVFYDNAHKQALGYQNPFYLKKAQRIKPTLYDGSVISDKHVASPVFDDDGMIFGEECQSKNDFGKRFVPQQELSAKQSFWYHMSNPSTKSSDASPVKVEAPKELPKVSLVNESLKKLKFHLAKFDSMVKLRTTPDAHTEGEWGESPMKEMSIMIICEIETKNVELENSVAKLLLENKRLCKEINHVKQVFKDQFDSIEKTRVHTIEQCDSLIDKLNLKSAENEDLKA
ncbi:hypothetical protein Tco_0716028 [Tanacetum coccineum]